MNYHTDELLRKHKLVLDTDHRAPIVLVDWATHKPASKKRVKKYLKELTEKVGFPGFEIACELSRTV